MANEYDFINAINSLNSVIETFERLWSTVDADWQSIEFSGPKRDELDGEVVEAGGSKSSAIGLLESAISVAETRRDGCIWYRQEMQKYNDGLRSEPDRPWYCDSLRI